MKVHELPDGMSEEYQAMPSWVINAAHGYALDWLAWGVREGYFELPTVEWLEGAAESSLQMAIEQYEEERNTDDEDS